MLGRDPGACVGDREERLPGVGDAGAEDDAVGLCVPSRNGLRRVLDQVYDDLSELGLVALDERRRAVLLVELRVVADLVADHAYRGVDQAVEIDARDGVAVDARERLEVGDDLPHTVGAVLRRRQRALDLGEALATERAVRGVGKLLQREIEVRDDIRERVVDLVGHAGCDRADRGEAIVDLELGLRLPKGAIVADDEDDAGELAVQLTERRAVERQQDELPCGRAEERLAIAERGLADLREEVGDEDVLAIVDELVKRRAQQLVVRAAEQGRERPVGLLDAPLGVEEHDAVLHRREGRLEHAALALQRREGLFDLDHRVVEEEGEHVHRIAPPGALRAHGVVAGRHAEKVLAELAHRVGERLMAALAFGHHAR